MNEQRFIQQNKGRWEQFEKFLITQGDSDPDHLSELYIQLMDDLSYARTHYRDSRLVRYLNQLALRAHKHIYGSRRERGRRFADLFTEEIPVAFLRYRKFLLYALLIFSGAIAVGWISNVLEPDFVRVVLGDSYVNQTMENIEKGDPMAVYKSAGAGEMFTFIAINNIRVSFLMYVLGAFAGIPTVLILLTNGIMVGSFLQFFFAHGLGWTAMTTIFLHGAVELSAIVLAGGCGLLLGSSMLFPGTYTRSQAMMQGARMSLKMILGVAPFIIVAALIEGFVTRWYLEMSEYLRLLIIIGTFAVLVWYVIIYPMKFKEHETEHRFQPKA